MPDDDQGPPGQAPEAPSKSALKRRMLALQSLGETLVGLSDRQLTRIPIDNARLLEVIREARAIHSHSARRRHLQLIGKLMRDTDAGPIAEALADMDRQRRDSAAAFQHLEQLREDVLAAGVGGTELVTTRWPEADRQQLRQFILQHQRESAQGKPPVASRRLFRYLRELQERYGEPD